MPRVRITLADVECPPDTSSLTPCDDVETAHAVERMRTRLLRQRKSLVQRVDARRALDSIVLGLRRLQNPQLAGFRCGASLLLSEPFNGVPSAIERAPRAFAERAVAAMFESRPPARLVNALAAFGERALTIAVSAGVHIGVVPDGKRFRDFSPAVASLVPGVDDWSAPPSGLFVVEEKRVLLRGRALTMTAAHEFAHAIDAVLARRPRSYFSFESEELRHYFSTATGFVNEYAASGFDEYFAESVRAYVEVNDARCSWLPLTRQDLCLRDPRMFGLVERLFASGFGSTERRASARSTEGA